MGIKKNNKRLTYVVMKPAMFFLQYIRNVITLLQ